MAAPPLPPPQKEEELGGVPSCLVQSTQKRVASKEGIPIICVYCACFCNMSRNQRAVPGQNSHRPSRPNEACSMLDRGAAIHRFLEKNKLLDHPSILEARSMYLPLGNLRLGNRRSHLYCYWVGSYVNFWINT